MQKSKNNKKIRLENVLNEYKIPQSTPDELYSQLFHLGEGYIQKKGEYRSDENKKFKGNPIIYVNDKASYDGKWKRYIGLEDEFLEQIHKAQKSPSNLLNAISYFGRKKNKEHSDRCFGLIFDIDGVDEITLSRFFKGAFSEFKLYPIPNFLVISKSGKGMHLYYIFDKPLRLYPKTKIKLKALKYDMTKWIWNPKISRNDKTQFQSYDQSFMIAGSKENMSVWHVREQLYPVNELFEMVGHEFDENDIWLDNEHTLEEAEELFPEWYQRVVVEGNTEKGHWTCKRDLYDWWIKKILDPVNGASYGHRYWCTMMLVIYGVKCGIPFDEVKKDAYRLMPMMNMIEHDKPFTKGDVKSALECYEPQFATFPIKDISKLSGIPIEKNKRNGRNQKKHLQGARAIRDINNPNWREGNGRKPKKDIVLEWRKNNPKGKKIECHRETGLSRVTIDKWWNA